MTFELYNNMNHNDHTTKTVVLFPYISYLCFYIVLKNQLSATIYTYSLSHVLVFDFGKSRMQRPWWKGYDKSLQGS